MSKTITKNQIKMIKWAQNRLGIDDDTYRMMLHERFRVESCKKMTFHQAEDLIKEFKSKGAYPKPGKRNPKPNRGKGKVIRLVSVDQLRKIGALACTVDWRSDDGFDRWCKKRFGLDRIVKASDAHKVIEGLKGMIENQAADTYGSDWRSRNDLPDQLAEYAAHHGGD